MAAQKGRTLLLKNGAVAGSPTTIGGAQVTGLTVNNELVDVTNKDSNGMRTLLEGAGTQSLTINISGVFNDSAAEETVRGYAFADSINTFSLFFPNGDTLEGSFQITNYERGGDHNDAETYSATLESSGAVTYTTN